MRPVLVKRIVTVAVAFLASSGALGVADVADADPDLPPPVAKARVEAPTAERYPWLADAAVASTSSGEGLASRFAAPAGFDRVEVAPRSFGAWLRGLPLAPRGTGVLSFRGDPVLAGDHDNLAAVVAIDAGTRDLMQCADSVIRMHAEWRWSEGARDQSYRALSGADIPFQRYLAGMRPSVEHNTLAWHRGVALRDDHAGFRRYLDDVFNWANTISLSAEAKPVPRAELRPGDFFVMPGGPGHAVLVLDVAKAGNKTALLLGQGFMPAQGFYVVRPSRASAWFVVEPNDLFVDTPFWRPFPWSTLRRFG
jgi:hypothetical protein